jgi:hypothetical protein
VLILLAVAIFCTPAPPVIPHPRPAPQVTDYADLALGWSGGRLTVESVTRGRFERPTALPRYRGRFVATARKKRRPLETLDETRFDFPLLADTESEDATPEARKLAKMVRAGVTAKTTVRVGLPDGADEIAIADSVTGRSVTVSLARSPAPPRGAPRAP